MWFEMQYHINQSLYVTVPIPATFTQAEGDAAVMLVLAGCMCIQVCFFILKLNKLSFVCFSIIFFAKVGRDIRKTGAKPKH